MPRRLPPWLPAMALAAGLRPVSARAVERPREIDASVAAPIATVDPAAASALAPRPGLAPAMEISAPLSAPAAVSAATALRNAPAPIAVPVLSAAPAARPAVAATRALAESASGPDASAAIGRAFDNGAFGIRVEEGLSNAAVLGADEGSPSSEAELARELAAALKTPALRERANHLLAFLRSNDAPRFAYGPSEGYDAKTHAIVVTRVADRALRLASAAALLQRAYDLAQGSPESAYLDSKAAAMRREVHAALGGKQAPAFRAQDGRSRAAPAPAAEKARVPAGKVDKIHRDDLRTLAELAPVLAEAGRGAFVRAAMELKRRMLLAGALMPGMLVHGTSLAELRRILASNGLREGEGQYGTGVYVQRVLKSDIESGRLLALEGKAAGAAHAADSSPVLLRIVGLEADGPDFAAIVAGNATLEHIEVYSPLRAVWLPAPALKNSFDPRLLEIREPWRPRVENGCAIVGASKIDLDAPGAKTMLRALEHEPPLDAIGSFDPRTGELLNAVARGEDGAAVHIQVMTRFENEAGVTFLLRRDGSFAFDGSGSAYSPITARVRRSVLRHFGVSPADETALGRLLRRLVDAADAVRSRLQVPFQETNLSGRPRR